MRGWRVFTISGIAVEINYSWLFILVMLVMALTFELTLAAPEAPAWQPRLGGLLTALLLFGSILAHELAHSFAARRYGVGVVRITLFLFGGVAQTKTEPPSATSEIVIAAVGPVASLLLGGLFLGLSVGADHLGLSQVVVTAAQRLGTINAMLAVFNLLPAFPLDGGRILRAALWEWWGDLLRSTAVATTMGRLIGALMVAWGLYQSFHTGILGGLWFLALGWLLSGAAQQALQATRLREALRRLAVHQAMQPLALALSPDTSIFTAVHQYLMPLRVPAIPVADAGVITGVLTADAIRKHPEAAWYHMRASQLMTPLDLEQMILPASADLAQALDRLGGGDQGYVLVVDDNGALVGLLAQEQLVAAAQAYGRG